MLCTTQFTLLQVNISPVRGNSTYRVSVQGAVYKCAVYKDDVCKGAVYKGAVYKGDVCKGAVYKGAMYKGAVYKGAVYKDAVY